MRSDTGRYYIGAFLIGIIISIMVIFNTELGKVTSSEVSTTVNQITGIVVLSAVMLIGRNSRRINPERKKASWYMYFGGVFGIVILSINYISVVRTGATAAMAGAVFGQSLMGFICDTTGLYGVRKQKISKRRAISLAVSLIGIMIMFYGGTIRFGYLLLAVFGGAVTLTQMIYNSRLSDLKGAFYSARVNVISGLFAVLIYAFIFYPENTVAGFRALPDVPFHLMVAGGSLACIVVVSCNLVMPRIPAVHSALLISSGQILSAVLLDVILYGTFSAPLLLGAAVMLIGIMITDKVQNK